MNVRDVGVQELRVAIKMLAGKQFGKEQVVSRNLHRLQYLKIFRIQLPCCFAVCAIILLFLIKKGSKKSKHQIYNYVLPFLILCSDFTMY
jgi:hypothetical protein